MVIEQYAVYWVDLNPTQGSEISKVRPCVVISPKELNDNLNTVIIIPITSTLRNYPFRIRCTLANKTGEIVTDQIRTVDKSRLRSKMSKLSGQEIEKLREILNEMLCQ